LNEAAEALDSGIEVRLILCGFQERLPSDWLKGRAISLRLWGIDYCAS
jgi:hypothetical protein